MPDYRQLRAVWAAALLGWMTLMGTPGLDLAGGPQIAVANRNADAWWSPVLRAIATVNIELRQPVVRRLSVLERPLGLAQSWGLYGGGPDQVTRVEILIDDQVQYRSGDSAAVWLEPALRYRRLRSITAGMCRDGKHSDGLRGWVARRARRDFPDARTVGFRCERSAWPGVDGKAGRTRTLSLRPEAP
ncbi:MAG: hypothetical protein ACI8PZ_006229 [Myxococcota bacterium]|jgi:hypothetical protein